MTPHQALVPSRGTTVAAEIDAALIVGLQAKNAVK